MSLRHLRRVRMQYVLAALVSIGAGIICVTTFDFSSPLTFVVSFVLTCLIVGLLCVGILSRDNYGASD